MVKDTADLTDEDVNPFFYSELIQMDNGRIIQGGALRTFRFEPLVQRAKLVLETQGLPLCVRIEVSQGPDNNKQVFDIYSEDGERFPVALAIEMPGGRNIMRILNAGTVEYPIIAWVESYTDRAPNNNSNEQQRMERSFPQNNNGSNRYENSNQRKELQGNGPTSNIKLPKLRIPTLNNFNNR
eukprot:scaffold24174_cov117-Cylindrotheca_fusiformis.AAC.1